MEDNTEYNQAIKDMFYAVENDQASSDNEYELSGRLIFTLSLYWL